jgi:hypothetical protein
MQAIQHAEARLLIQSSMDRTLTSEERRRLEDHLDSCGECLAYEQVHQRLAADTNRFRAAVDEGALHMGAQREAIFRGVQRKRRERTFVAGAKYTAMAAVLILAAVVISSALPDGARSPTATAVGAAGVSTPTRTPTRTPAPTASPGISPTPRIAFDFGSVLAWSEVRLFRRGKQDVVGADAIRGDPARQSGLTIDEVSAEAGFELRIPDSLPQGFAFEQAWYDPTHDSVGICYVGPLDPSTLSRPRMCLRERAAPFQDFVGHSAAVHHTSIGGVDAEYVRGGWLSISSGTPATQYQWNPRMVPQTSLRFIRSGVYISISQVAMDCTSAAPVCPPTLALAERLLQE